MFVEAAGFSTVGINESAQNFHDLVLAHKADEEFNAEAFVWGQLVTGESSTAQPQSPVDAPDSIRGEGVLSDVRSQSMQKHWRLEIGIGPYMLCLLL